MSPGLSSFIPHPSPRVSMVVDTIADIACIPKAKSIDGRFTISCVSAAIPDDLNTCNTRSNKMLSIVKTGREKKLWMMAHLLQ